MGRSTGPRRLTRHYAVALVVATAVWAGTGVIRAQSDVAATSAISGTVKADKGEVRAFRVRARDTEHGIVYTVFTRQGRYRVPGLIPSTYEIQVVEEGFEAPTRTIVLRPGESPNADLALTALPANTRDAALLDYDQLYPPGPGRTILEQHCWGCHGTDAGWHRRGGKTEADWAKAFERMYDVKAYLAKGKIAGIGAPPALEHALTAEMKDTVVKYLAATFPPNHSPRDFKLDPLVRDEDALSQALYIEWDLPPVTAPDFSDGKPTRSVHDVVPSSTTRGLLWGAGTGSGSIVSVDTTHPEYSVQQRTREYFVPHPANINSKPHGLTERRGKVYYAGLGDDSAGELDPATGTFQRYTAPTAGGGGHTITTDSKGNLWFTTVYGHTRIHKVDAVTKKVTEFNPYPGANWYGIIADKQDRIWAVGYGSFFGVIMYDQKKNTWTQYPTSATNRRLTMDPNGIIWANQYFGNAISSIDPETGKVTEYKLPLKYGNPYEGFSDLQGNIWIENAMYNSLVKFDQTSKKFTYYPFPDHRMHTPKLSVGSDGTLYFSRFSGRPPRVVAFKPTGNRTNPTSATR
jgi:streptogramin lyase/mono/diheme cytochrome c family protein